MADYYWNGSTGNDANDGSSGSPWLTFTGAAPAAAIAALASGDTMHLAGTFRPTLAALGSGATVLTLTSRTGVTVRQWAGQAQAVIRGDAVVSGTWVDATTHWTLTITTGLTISGFTVAYDANTWTGTNGRTLYRGMQRPVAAGSVPTTDWSANYTSGTGAVLLRTNGSLDPNTVVVTAVRGGDYKLMDLVSCTGCTVIGIKFFLCSLTSTSSGYGFSITAGSGNAYIDCEAYDCAYHNYGAIGSTNTGNKFYRCIAGGSGSSSTVAVHYSDTDIIDGAYIQCESHVFYHRDYAGDSIYSSPTGGAGFTCHTAGAVQKDGGNLQYRTGNEVISLLYDRCKVYCYPGTSPSVKAFSHLDLPLWTEDPWSTAGRAVVLRQCETWDDTYIPVSNPVWFDRCVLRFTQAGATTASTTAIFRLTEQRAGGTLDAASPTFLTLLPLLTDCTIVSTMTGTSYGARFTTITTTLAYTSGSGMYMQNCVWVETDTNADATNILDYNSKANCTYHARGCVFTGSKTGTFRLCGTDGSIAANMHDFSANAYSAFSVFSANTGLDTQADWTANVETGTAGAAPVYSTAALLAVDSSGVVPPWSSARGGQYYQSAVGPRQGRVTDAPDSRGYLPRARMRS